MSEELKQFLVDSEKVAFDRKHRSKIKFNMSRYDAAVEKGKNLYYNQESARKKAAHLKEKIIYDLEKYIIQFQRNIESRGAKVLFAIDSEDAIKSVLEILKKHKAKTLVKSKSMITEEIEFNDHVEKAGVESVETDLGEYIVQVAGEKPYHIVTPAMHKSKEDVAKLFHEKFNTPPESTPEEITNFVRHHLRDKFLNADIGVTGANFLVAETGSVALTENEGNGMMSFSFPKVHIVIAGIEKLIPSLTDVDLFWPLLATNGTGQNITVYNSLISGPKQSEEGQKASQLASFVGNLAQFNPETLDKVDFDKMIDIFGLSYGINPKLIRDEDEVNQIRQARAQQQQQQQQMEQTAQAAQSAKTLSETDTGDGNALEAMMGQM